MSRCVPRSATRPSGRGWPWSWVVAAAAASLVLGAPSGPAAAADPLLITVRPPGGPPIDVTAQPDLVAIGSTLCTQRPATVPAGRQGLEIVVRWTERTDDGLTWRGTLYPATGSAPAVVHIPDWKLYTGDASPRTCEHRVAGDEAVAVLAKYGVPVREERSTGAGAAPLAGGIAAIGALALAATIAWRRRTSRAV